MASHTDWREVYDFWFPVDLSEADVAAHWQMLAWWMRGGANAELHRFAPLVRAARAGELDRWRSTPLGRLCLIIVLDQFPRGLFAGAPDAYSSDPETVRLAEEGFDNGHYDALTSPYERFFYFLPLAHAEGPDHLERMRRIVAISEQALDEAPEHLKPVWQFSLSQARANFDIIARFGRFPHRNPVLGRHSTPEELTYLAKGDFVHTRSLPASASSAISAVG
ncbi:DUF924 domain-containing protein [Microvirga terrae]|uniref:DUF924 domain-containing protein n=1 Tax=Microvirga terrae TaxID=2740529 RepID=A0ABY5RN43_9HYPH|nr:DUF924 family protein [Microvirga terrae]UVF18314.1 DUF924 domain-containing protein [Microvirga terrae]